MGEADLGADAGFGRGLDALRHRLDQQLAGERQQRLQEPALGERRLIEARDEAVVELEVVRRRLGELEQARLAGAEVVVGERDVALEQQPAQLGDRRRARQHALVDLERQVEVRRDFAQLLERLEQPWPQKLGRMGVEEDRGQVAALRGQLDGLAPEQPAQVPLAPDVFGDLQQLERASLAAAGELLRPSAS